jgi:hypothetical protein
MYPYLWLWNNSNPFVKLCGNRLQGSRLKVFAAMGLCVQFLPPISLTLFAAGRFVGAYQFFDISTQCAVLYAFSYALLIFPQRCYCFFHLRWNIRNAVAAWDREEMMIGRTMTSWLKLFLFGSAYIQFHMNRLMGLGMPGFADQEEIRPDFSIQKWLREYVLIRRPAIDIPNDLKESDDG